MRSSLSAGVLSTYHYCLYPFDFYSNMNHRTTCKEPTADIVDWDSGRLILFPHPFQCLQATFRIATSCQPGCFLQTNLHHLMTWPPGVYSDSPQLFPTSLLLLEANPSIHIHSFVTTFVPTEPFSSMYIQLPHLVGTQNSYLPGTLQLPQLAMTQTFLPANLYLSMTSQISTEPHIFFNQASSAKIFSKDQNGTRAVKESNNHPTEVRLDIYTKNHFKHPDSQASV